jgi:glycine betaine/proline transport system substrate-binding protein
MKGFRRLLAAALATFGLLASSVPVSAAQAPIHFADLNGRAAA